MTARHEAVKGSSGGSGSTGRSCRRVIRELLAEPITVTPVETEDGGVAFDYAAEAKLDPILTGRIAGPRGARYDGRASCFPR